MLKIEDTGERYTRQGKSAAAAPVPLLYLYRQRHFPS